jgi:hypothetical protein
LLNATVDDIGMNEAASGLGALRERDHPRRTLQPQRQFTSTTIQGF